MSIISFTFLATLVATSCAISILPDIMIGTCVESCSSSLIIRAARGLGVCSAGYECRSNGCGHTCQPVLVKKAAIMCPMIGCLNYCVDGYVLGSNGCPTCTCSPKI